MAGSKIKNTVETEFVTKGGKKVAKDTEQIGRAQTRLGQASSSTGRQFSAQASGLGGLVAAYAGAAANVFAITQAFAALQRAAQAETIVQGTKTLALEIGANGSEIISKVQQITQSQLSLAEASQSINIALSAGFNTEQIEGLTTVSMKASRALGRTLTDAFTRVTRGAAKLEPELLDELGIFTRIDPAVEAYAAKLNVATSSLTKFEKRQAFVNAVIDEGNRKFSSIDTSVPSSQKSIEQLMVSLTDLATEFGQIIANILTPLADFFSKNLGNALLLFGGVLALVFGKAGQLIGAFVTNSSKRFEAFANRLAASSSKVRASLSEITASIAGSSDFDSKGGVGRFATGDRSKNVQLQADLRGLAGGSIKDATEQRKAVDRLTTAISNKEIAQKLDAKTLKNARVVTAAYTTGLKAQGVVTNLATAASLKLSAAIGAVGTAVNFAMPYIGIFLGALSAIQLISSALGFDIFGKIAEFFSGISAETKAFAAGAYGAFVYAAGGAKQLENALVRIKGALLKEEDFEEFKERVTKIINEVRIASTTFGGPGGGIEGFLPEEMTELVKMIEFTRQLTIARRFLKVEEEKGAEGDKTRILILRNQIKSMERLGNQQALAGMITKNLGISTEKTAELLAGSVDVAADGSVFFRELGISIDLTSKGFTGLTDVTQKNIETLMLLKNTLKTATEAFDKGAASSETLSKKLIGAQKAQEFLLRQGFVDPAQRRELIKLTKDIDDLSNKVRGLKAAETVGKAIRDTFGGAIKALDTAFAKGLIGGGGIAKTAQEAAANQVAFLQATIKLGNEAEKNKKTDSISLEQIRAKNTALKALVGLSFQSAQAIEKQVKETKKLLRAEQARKELLVKQGDLKKAEQALALQRVQQAGVKKELQLTIQLRTKELEIFDAEAAVQNKTVQIQKQKTALLREELDLIRETDAIKTRTAAAEAIAASKRGVTGQKAAISAMEETPGLFSTQQMQEEQKRLINLEFQLGMQIIEEKERVAREEYANEIKLLGQRRADLNQDLTRNLALQQKALERADLENKVADKQAEMKRSELANEEANLKKASTIEEKRIELIKKQSEIAAKEVIAQDKIREQQLMSTETQVAAVNLFAASNNQFTKAVEAYAKAQNVGVDKIRTVSPLELDRQFKDMKKLMNDASTLQRQNIFGKGQLGIDAAESKKSQIGEQLVSNKDQLKLLNELLESEKKLRENKQDNAQTELIEQNTLIRKKLDNLGLEKDKIDELLKEKLSALADEEKALKQAAAIRLLNIKRENDMMRKLGDDISGVLKEQLGGSIKDLFKAIADGTLTTKNFKEGFQAMLGNIFEGIREKVLQRTLIDPMNDFIDEAIGGLFGGEKGIDQVKLTSDGSVPVSMSGMMSGISSNQDMFKMFGLDAEKHANEFMFLDNKIEDTSFTFSGFLDSVKEKGRSTFDSITNFVGKMLNNITNSFSGGGSGFSISSLFSLGSGDVASTAASSMMPMVTASGGMIPGVRHMAAGGYAGGSPRDRVPALLEPGEFVMKRSAASNIGANNLQAMNNGGIPNIKVQVKNEGTPQEATTAEPRLDVDSIVIDIVTRDLRNNGPIRKSMRGGS